MRILLLRKQTNFIFIYFSGPVKYIRVGELDYRSTTDSAEPQDFTVTQVIKHPQWKPPLQYNDIMLLKMNKPAKFGIFVRPICLHTTFEIPPSAVGKYWCLKNNIVFFQELMLYDSMFNNQ